MDFLKEWGAHILVSQIIVGGIAGVFMAFFGDDNPVMSALRVAALVAIFYSVVIPINIKGVALGLLATTLFILSVFSHLMYAAVLCALTVLAASAFAAVPTKFSGSRAEESFLYLVICASPFGALMHLMDRLDDERRKMFKR